MATTCAVVFPAQGARAKLPFFFLLPCCHSLRTIGFFLRLDLYTSGRLESGDHRASFAPVSLIFFSASRFIVSCVCVCVCQVPCWRGDRDRRQGLFVFLFVCARLQRPVMCGDIAVTQRPHRRCCEVM